MRSPYRRHYRKSYTEYELSLKKRWDKIFPQTPGRPPNLFFDEYSDMEQLECIDEMNRNFEEWVKYD